MDLKDRYYAALEICDMLREDAEWWKQQYHKLLDIKRAIPHTTQTLTEAANKQATVLQHSNDSYSMTIDEMKRSLSNWVQKLKTQGKSNEDIEQHKYFIRSNQMIENLIQYEIESRFMIDILKVELRKQKELLNDIHPEQNPSEANLMDSPREHFINIGIRNVQEIINN